MGRGGRASVFPAAVEPDLMTAPRDLGPSIPRACWAPCLQPLPGRLVSWGPLPLEAWILEKLGGTLDPPPRVLDITRHPDHIFQPLTPFPTPSSKSHDQPLALQTRETVLSVVTMESLGL